MPITTIKLKIIQNQNAIRNNGIYISFLVYFFLFVNYFE